jgi:MtrB/PioB family decaheme-associated outer membrane protein
MKQKNTLPPRRRILTLAVGAALASLVAAPAFADPLMTIKLFRDSEVMFRDADMSRWAENYVELGVGYNSADSLRFGQFSGLTDKGGFPLAGFNWISRTDANDAQYWLIHGANLGLDSRKLKAEGGVQGAWEASFSFDGLKKSQTESASFVHDGLGTNNLTLPAGWAAAADAQAATLTARLRPFEIAHGRDIYRLGLKGLLGNEWDYKVSYREDRRDGTRMTGLPLTTGGRAIIVPYAIDDKTSQIDAVLSYTSKVANFQLGYHYSRFTNDFNALNVQNPFVAAGAATQNAAMSLAPGNDLHQITATGGYKFSKDTRLNATLSRSIGKQNDAFLPYSANVASAAAPLPKSSLEGEVVKTLLDVALTARPIDKMNLKVAYRYHDDKNRTPITQFVYYSRDATAATSATAAGGARSNAPVSTTEKRYSVDADYEVAPKTTLRAGFEHTDKSYTLTDVTGTKTNKLSLELRKPLLDEFQGALGYTHTQRRGSNYDKSVFFTNTYTNTTFQSSATGRLTNHPSMRAFMYADFNEDRVRTSGNWTVSETLSLQGVVDAFKQKMRGPDCGMFTNPLQQGALAINAALPDSCLGRDTATGTSASLDLQYQPEENLTTFGFLNVVQTGIREVGRNWTKAGTTGADTSRDFYGDMVHTDHTAGFGLKWQPEERWDLGGTYVLNLGRGRSDVTTAAGYNQANSGTGGSVPDTWSRLHTLQLFAKWDYSKQLTWRFNYLYENLNSYDWALSNVGAQSNAGILLTGQQAPRYSNHVFGVSAVVKSW